MTNVTGSPAQRLLGSMLPDGWVVTERLERGPNLTGAAGSVGYRVETRDGQRAFLKALDLTWALRRTANPSEMTTMVEFVTAAYNHERDLLRRCRNQRMRRVVSAITDGYVDIDPDSPIGVVPYLIFEEADGDIRHYMDLSAAFDVAWALRSLHHVATGLSQLHSAEIAHQDVKPSNVLVFGGRSSKVADLGSAALRTRAGPFDQAELVGDPAYAPPELLYRQISPEWNARRFGCDAYLLGSLVVFFFARLSMTALLLDHLDKQFWPQRFSGGWNGDYAAVLPYVQDAFAKALADFRSVVPLSFRSDLATIVNQLCEPDLAQRGHPKSRIPKGNPYSLERYVSRFNSLATRAEKGLMGPRV